MSNLSRDQAAALKEFVVEDFKDGRGKDARDSPPAEGVCGFN